MLRLFACSGLWAHAWAMGAVGMGGNVTRPSCKRWETLVFSGAAGGQHATSAGLSAPEVQASRLGGHGARCRLARVGTVRYLRSGRSASGSSTCFPGWPRSKMCAWLQSQHSRSSVLDPYPLQLWAHQSAGALIDLELSRSQKRREEQWTIM
jgi:hypothetical protein